MSTTTAPTLRRLGPKPIPAPHQPTMSKPLALSTPGSGKLFSNGAQAESVFDELDVPVIEMNSSGSSVNSSAEGSICALTAEQLLVGAVLQDNGLFDVVTNIVAPDCFSDTSARTAMTVVAAILNGEVEGVRVADSLTVSMRPGVASIVSMHDLSVWASWPRPTSEVIESYATVVRDESRARSLQRSLTVASSIANDSSLSIDERTERVEREFVALDSLKTRKAKGVGQFAVSAIDAIIDRASRGTSMIGATTGLQDLDSLLAGLQAGQLIIIAARPSMGKSALALGIGLAAAKAGTPGTMYSFEMSGDDFSLRALSFMSGVDASKLRVGALTEGEWTRVMDAAQALQTLPFTIDDNASASLSELRTSARRLHREGKLKLLIVDYIQIMSGGSKISREQQIAEISRGLKLLAKELSIPVIALSQLNRGVELRVDKRPMMSDLRESGAIEQDADVIMFVYRDDFYNPNSTDAGLAEIIVGKQRSGSTGTIKVKFEKQTVKFSDLYDPNQQSPCPAPTPISKSTALAAPPVEDFLPPMVR